MPSASAMKRTIKHDDWRRRDRALAAMCDHPVLTRSQTNRLVRRAQKGSAEALHQLVRHNLRFVMRIAREIHRGRGQRPLEDMVGEGVAGLITAIHRFEPERGLALITFAAHWIRHHILRSITDEGRLMRLPVHLDERLLRFKRRQAVLLLRENRVVTDPAEAARLASTEAQPVAAKLGAVILEVAERRTFSLDRPQTVDDEHGTRHDVISVSGPEQEDLLLEGQVRTRVRAALARLPEIERKVLERRFGFTGGDDRTFQDISHDDDLPVCSREQIRKLHLRALERLRPLLQDMA